MYFEEGKSLREVSKVVDLTKANIRNRLVAAGYSLRSPMQRGWANPLRAPVEHPTTLDIAWAAGIFEGEGYVGVPFAKYGPRHPIVSVVQKDEWLTERLRILFGGTNKRYGKDRRIYSYWRLTGARATGFLMTIYKFLSPRRQQQIRDAFEKSGVRPAKAA